MKTEKRETFISAWIISIQSNWAVALRSPIKRLVLRCAFRGIETGCRGVRQERTARGNNHNYRVRDRRQEDLAAINMRSLAAQGQGSVAALRVHNPLALACLTCLGGEQSAGSVSPNKSAILRSCATSRIGRQCARPCSVRVGRGSRREPLSGFAGVKRHTTCAIFFCFFFFDDANLIRRSIKS